MAMLRNAMDRHILAQDLGISEIDDIELLQNVNFTKCHPYGWFHSSGHWYSRTKALHKISNKRRKN